MTGRVQQHTPLVRSGLVRHFSGTQRDGRICRRFQVLHRDVQVKLLALWTFGPRWRDIAVHTHQRQHRAGSGEGNNTSVGSSEGLFKSQKLGVKTSKHSGVGAIKRNGRKLSNGFTHDHKPTGRDLSPGPRCAGARGMPRSGGWPGPPELPDQDL